MSANPQRSNALQNSSDETALQDSSPGFGRTVKFWLCVTVLPNLCLVLLLIVWSLIAHALGIPLVPASDIGGWLATIGGVMGAIFTAGGIIVALVAVISQLMLEDRVKRAVAEAKQLFQDQYERELAPNLKERARQQVKAQIAFFQATIAGHWKSAEQFTDEALGYDPDLEGARSFLGMQMSTAVGRHFFDQLYGLSRSIEALLAAQRSSQVPATEPPTVTQAILRLKDALDHQDNPGGQASAELALMYGYAEMYDEMLAAIKESLRIDKDLTRYFLPTYRLTMLLWACKQESERMKAVGALLGHSLPVPQAVIRASYEQTDTAPSTPGQGYVEWFALEYGRFGKTTSKLPATIRIWGPSKEDNQKPYYATSIVPPNYGQAVRFPLDENLNPTIDELLAQLDKQWFFIGPKQAIIAY